MVARSTRPLWRQAESLPAEPGVYAFRDKKGNLLYVGKAINLKRRVSSYLKPGGGHNLQTRKLKRVACRIEHMETGSDLEALLVESKVIREDQPAYNVMGRTVRHYPFVRIGAEPFPKVEVVRELVWDGSRYFGPFPSEVDLDVALSGLQSIAKWRKCSTLGRRPCLHFETGNCLAPCTGRDAARYEAAIDLVEEVLRGRGELALARLRERMERAAAALEYEYAARLRDRSRALAMLVDRVPLLALEVVLLYRKALGVRLVAVRSGRVVAAAEALCQEQARAFVHGAWSYPPPGPARTPGELREIDIVSGYLFHHRGKLSALAPGEAAIVSAVSSTRPHKAGVTRGKPLSRKGELGPETVVVLPGRIREAASEVGEKFRGLTSRRLRPLSG